MLSVSPGLRSLQILELLAPEAHGLPLSGIGQRCGLPKSVVHRTLAMLVERGYVAQDPLSQRYRLTMKVAALGLRFVQATRIPDVAQPVLDDLAGSSGEFVRLAVVHGEGLIWMARAQGATSALRYDPMTGPDVILHSTATGAAWLATLAEDEAVRIVLNRGFAMPPNYGLHAVRTVPQLLDKLRSTRARGWASALEEGEIGTNAVAVAFAGEEHPDAPAVGTVSIAAPSIRLTEDRMQELVPALQEAAHRLTVVWPLRTYLTREAASRQEHAMIRAEAGA